MRLVFGIVLLYYKPLKDALECKRAVKWLCDYIATQCSRPPPAHSKDLHSSIVAAFQVRQSSLKEYMPKITASTRNVDVRDLAGPPPLSAVRQGVSEHRGRGGRAGRVRQQVPAPGHRRPHHEGGQGAVAGQQEGQGRRGTSSQRRHGTGRWRLSRYNINTS